MIAFWASFVVTLALLGAAAWSGFRGRRRLHFWLAPAALAMLAVTVVLTEQLLRSVRFPERELAIHLAFAKTGAALVVPVVLTGLLAVRRRRLVRWHLAAVGLFFLVALTATGTGIWVFALSSPR